MNAFPSPVGESYFSIMMKSAIRKRKSGFLSPVGESYFSIKSKAWLDDLEERFPSPVGESYFSIILAWIIKKCIFKVSVPYRGILFFNRMEIKDIRKLISFRPLSGNLIFQ